MATSQLAQDGLSPQSSNEIWKPVPSEPGVLVSSWGRVVLMPRYAPLPNGGYRAYMPRPTYGYVAKSSRHAKHEYMLVTIKSAGRPGQSSRKAHRLVCEAFHGPPPFEKAVVIHLDEDAKNNRPENLRWGTQKENLNAPGFIEYCRSRVGDKHPQTIKRARQAGATPWQDAPSTNG